MGRHAAAVASPASNLEVLMLARTNDQPVASPGMTTDCWSSGHVSCFRFNERL